MEAVANNSDDDIQFIEEIPTQSMSINFFFVTHLFINFLLI